MFSSIIPLFVSLGQDSELRDMSYEHTEEVSLENWYSSHGLFYYGTEECTSYMYPTLQTDMVTSGRRSLIGSLAANGRSSEEGLVASGDVQARCAAAGSDALMPISSLI